MHTTQKITAPREHITLAYVDYTYSSRRLSNPWKNPSGRVDMVPEVRCLLHGCNERGKERELRLCR